MVTNPYLFIKPVPYPYRAMLAICSDLDETTDKKVYFETMRFLNTTEKTTMGDGIGLEVGNTIYFDMPPQQFSYWNTDDKGRDVIRTLIKTGHIDCLHSYGDHAITRAHAERALNELSRHNCKLDVWIDHGRAPSNFGQDIMQGQGDIVRSQIYHADITSEFGIKYVWLGRVTSIIGQGVPRRLSGIWKRKRPLVSLKALLKETAKGILSNCGNNRYALHGPNKVLREARLRSGQQVFEFIRSNPHWGGISCGDNADGLSEVLTDDILSRLVKRGGFGIIYTHLGKYKNKEEPFGEQTKRALRLLSRYSRDGKILVTTTSRLLRFYSAIQNINMSMCNNGDSLQVDLSTKDSIEDLGGLSLYVPSPDKTKVVINGCEVKNLQSNAPDHTGQACVSLSWRPLGFPSF